MDKDQQEQAKLKEILREHKAEKCPTCGHEIGWGDVKWNNGTTGSGTEYCTVQIQCEGCQREIAHVDSWMPNIVDNDDVLFVLQRDWGKYI